MKSFLHHFRGFGIHESDCMVHIIENDGKHFVLFEDIDSGTSVTNSSEQLAGEIVREYKLDPNNCRFFETYRQYDYDTFDEIEYTWKMLKLGELDMWHAKKPNWKPASEKKQLFSK